MEIASDAQILEYFLYIQKGSKRFLLSLGIRSRIPTQAPEEKKLKSAGFTIYLLNFLDKTARLKVKKEGFLFLVAAKTLLRAH